MKDFLQSVFGEPGQFPARKASFLSGVHLWSFANIQERFMTDTPRASALR
jgi:hypothetical protein